MILALISFDNDNKSFLTHLSRYNNLLESYYNNDDITLVSKIKETFKNIIDTCIKYKILNEEQSEIYSSAMNFLANEVNKNDLNILHNNVNYELAEKIGEKLKDFDQNTLKTIHEFSQKMLEQNNQIEIIYIPTIIDVNIF